MKRADFTNISLHDYDPALKSAVSWLGDRYLLAEPVRRRAEEFKGYYVEPRRWLGRATREPFNAAPFGRTHRGVSSRTS